MSVLGAAATVLVLAALADGITTARAIRRGFVELNPLFGKRPSGPRVLLIGAAIISGEISLALLFSRQGGASAAVSALLSFQAGVHAALAWHNERL